MKILNAATVWASVLFLTGEAQAFDFGFVRVPDWMDSYILWTALLTGISMIGLTLTKPRGVPFNQLPKVKISALANIFRFIALISVIVLMGLIFLGMGLARSS